MSSFDFGIYIHVPWCRRRCVYCDFAFDVGRPTTDFTQLIQQEWGHKKQDFCSLKPAASLYFGGGTPSLLSAASIRELIDFFDRAQALGPACEITLEANPEDLTLEKVRDYQAAGITRISLGIQSFEAPILKYLGRKHTPKDALLAVEYCTKYIPKTSVDIILGVDGENLETLCEHLDFLNQASVKHISTYQLTVEPKTPLSQLIHKGLRSYPKEENQCLSYERVQNYLKKIGFIQYEVSSFSKNEESIHNRIYWAGGTYIGLGPSAHSMDLLENGSVARHENPRHFALWAQRQKGLSESLTPQKAFLEALAFGIRHITRGVNIQALCTRHQVESPVGLKEVLQKLSQKELIYLTKECAYLTEKGTLFCDTVSRELLSI